MKPKPVPPAPSLSVGPPGPNKSLAHMVREATAASTKVTPKPPESSSASALLDNKHSEPPAAAAAAAMAAAPAAAAVVAAVAAAPIPTPAAAGVKVLNTQYPSILYHLDHAASVPGIHKTYKEVLTALEELAVFRELARLNRPSRRGRGFGPDHVLNRSALPDVKSVAPGDPVVALSHCLEGLATAAAGLEYGLLTADDVKYATHLAAGDRRFLSDVGSVNCLAFELGTIVSLRSELSCNYHLNVACNSIDWPTADFTPSQRAALWKRCHAEAVVSRFAPSAVKGPLYLSGAQPSLPRPP